MLKKYLLLVIAMGSSALCSEARYAADSDLVTLDTEFEPSRGS